MIVSRLELSVEDMRNLNIKGEYAIHQLVYSMFPGTEELGRDFLYVKKEQYKRKLVIFVLSQRNPTTPNYCKLECRKLPKDFLYCNEYYFTVKANPVKRSKKTKKLYPVMGNDALIKWFCTQAEKSGMHVDPRKIFIVDKGIEKITKDQGDYVFSKVTFQGEFSVVNRETFIKTFQIGFGKGRAFGFGLLELQAKKSMF